jgi:hypothetical protein
MNKVSLKFELSDMAVPGPLLVVQTLTETKVWQKNANCIDTQGNYLLYLNSFPYACIHMYAFILKQHEY